MRSLLPALALVAASALVAQADITDRLDQKAPDVACTKWWNGKAPKMSQLKKRVVVLHFHGPKKITSKAFEGRVKELYEAHAERPFTLIEILVDCDATEAASYVARSGAVWHVGVDAKGASAAKYPGSSVPRTYVIGPDGVVAFHAHLAALKDDVLDAQFTRARWYDEKSYPKTTHKMLRAARERRFGLALEESALLLEKGKDDAKELAAEVETEIRRYHAFQTKVVKALEKELDWAIVQRRVELMREIYRGTEFAGDVEAWWARLEANPRVAYVAAAQKRLEQILEKTNPNKKNDVEAAIRELRDVMRSWANTKPAERAEEWTRVFEKRLSDGLAR